jgi:putative transcriptional regulator
MEILTSPGTLLLSVPQMQDPNFMHSVVLICEHSSDGAYGLMVNRPANISVAELVPDHSQLETTSFPVHLGGPVGSDTLQFLHRVPHAIPGGHELAGGLYVGGEVEALSDYIAAGTGALENVRLFVGYSGWMGGQLDMELQTGSWVPLPPSLDIIFRPGAPETTWRHAMRSLGEGGAGLSSLPPDVSWN